MATFPYFLPELEVVQRSERNPEPLNELNVSFGYKCSVVQDVTSVVSFDSEILPGTLIPDSRSSSFSCLSGAALSANYTLANTNIGNGLIGEEILPGLDSPNSFKNMSSSPSFSRLDSLSSSSPNDTSLLAGTIPSDHEMLEGSKGLWRSSSAAANLESSSFLQAMDLKMAGGAAGEDRVQVVCSEENGWLYCGVYDGFNGRDAADFLASTLYENIAFNMQLFEWGVKQEVASQNASSETNHPSDDITGSASCSANELVISKTESDQSVCPGCTNEIFSSESFSAGIINCLTHSLSQAESEFMHMVEQEMNDRPDLVSVGSCVLAMFLLGRDLFIMNLGDSRAVLATKSVLDGCPLQAIQLTEIHTIENELEHKKILADHPDDPSPIIGGRVKGKLKVTRALGVGYLKKKKMNNALMGILRVRNLCDPPYIHVHPFIMSHKISENDQFVILGSDGLFDFLENSEAVEVVHQFIKEKPYGDPAKHLVEQLVLRAAKHACISTEELMKVPVGRRRKYHDDVTVIVIILGGNKKRTSTASTSCKGWMAGF